MERIIRILLIAMIFLVSGCLLSAHANSSNTRGILVIQGKVLDAAGNLLPDAAVTPYRDGKLFRQGVKHGSRSDSQGSTGQNGLFRLELQVSLEEIDEGAWSLKVIRPSFKPSDPIPLTKILDQGRDSDGIKHLAATTTVILERYHGTTFWIALIVFILVYVLIAFEILHRSLAAFLGATVILLITHTLGAFDESYRILTYEQALRAVDWNVIFLLMGMMIIVGVLKVSGIFQWCAYKSFQISGGNIFALSVTLCAVTAVASAFLDNVTTMLLLTPVTIEIALILGVSPFVFLMPVIVASNFGGTATLIGDPPNIMIGSYAGLTFNDFMITLTPVVLVVMITQFIYNKFLYGRDYRSARVDDAPKMIAFLREKYPITDRRVLTIGGLVLIGVIFLFILHGKFHMEVSVAALFGAALIIVLNRMEIVPLLEHDVDWPSLIFFVMLFIVVGAAEQAGILQAVADWILKVCRGNLTVAVLLVLWVGGIGSAIVDNIPFTATMLPIVAFLNKTIPGAESGVLWWALALGACFGGNGTIIGASANVVTMGLAEKSGHKITFFQFVKEAGPITIISLVISSVFLLVFFQSP